MLINKTLQNIIDEEMFTKVYYDYDESKAKWMVTEYGDSIWGNSPLMADSY